MKKTVFLLILYFCAIFIASCKKNDSSPITDTFLPGSYLPVYPSSWWKYVTGSDTMVSRTSDSLVEMLGIRLTTLDGWPINGYDEFYYNSMYDMGWVKVLSVTVGATWSHFLGDPRTNPYTQVTRVMQKTVDAHGDSVIIQRYYVYHAEPPLYNPAYTWQIFKKNVGMVLECKVDTSDQDTIYKKVLVDFHINH